jgi:hypothetical protein
MAGITLEESYEVQLMVYYSSPEERSELYIKTEKLIINAGKVSGIRKFTLQEEHDIMLWIEIMVRVEAMAKGRGAIYRTKRKFEIVNQYFGGFNYLFFNSSKNTDNSINYSGSNEKLIDNLKEYPSYEQKEIINNAQQQSKAKQEDVLKDETKSKIKPLPNWYGFVLFLFIALIAELILLTL